MSTPEPFDTTPTADLVQQVLDDSNATPRELALAERLAMALDALAEVSS